MTHHVTILALMLALSAGCSAVDQEPPPADNGMTAQPAAAATPVREIHVATDIVRVASSTGFAITYDNVLYSDGTIIADGSIPSVAPARVTHTFTMAVDGPPSDWYATNPIVFETATDQWTISLGQVAGTLNVGRQPYGHKVGTMWVVPAGESWIVSIP